VAATPTVHLLVHHVHVVVVLGPVIGNRFKAWVRPGSDLMDQCSHGTPSNQRYGSPTGRPGTI
jgi:hypothetical protein